MSNPDFWTVNANVQIATALILIVILLTYIAFRLTPSKKSPKTAKA